jgi:hypothetical protein
MKMKFTGFYLEFLRIFSICFKCRAQENPDGLQLPGVETPSDTRPPPSDTRPPPSDTRPPPAETRPPPSDTRPAPPVTRPPETRQLGTSSSQSSPAHRTPHITGDRESSPGHEGESEALDDLAEDVAESEAVSKKYFKGSSIIQGSNQKSHDMALLETVLTYMVDHQVIIAKIMTFSSQIHMKKRFGTINMTQVARDTRARHPLSFGSRPISEISKLAKTRINK